jgi:hypothetical protein
LAATYFILKAGIAPPGLSKEPPAVRLMFWQWVVEAGLKRKDWELARGLNAKGEPLAAVRAATAKHRTSAMTPSGKGDPRAPYLMPGRGLSRTRSLLAGKAHADYAEFFWRYDPHTGDQWGKILAVHAARGEAYNVVGLSPAGIAAVALQAQKRWRQWLASSAALLAPARAGAAASAQQPPAALRSPIGSTNLAHATFGIGATKDQAQKAIDEGRSSGFMTAADWLKHWRSKAGPVSNPNASPSVQRGSSNVILQHIQRRPAMTQAAFDQAISNLVASVEAGYTVAQVESIVGELFEPALAEAVRRGLIVIAKDSSGTPRLKVVR